MGKTFDLRNNGGNGTVKNGCCSPFSPIFLVSPPPSPFPPFHPLFQTPKSWFGGLVSLVAVSAAARQVHTTCVGLGLGLVFGHVHATCLGGLGMCIPFPAVTRSVPVPLPLHICRARAQAVFNKAFGFTKLLRDMSVSERINVYPSLNSSLVLRGPVLTSMFAPSAMDTPGLSQDGTLTYFTMWQMNSELRLFAEMTTLEQVSDVARPQRPSLTQ